MPWSNAAREASLQARRSKARTKASKPLPDMSEKPDDIPGVILGFAANEASLAQAADEFMEGIFDPIESDDPTNGPAADDIDKLLGLPDSNV